MTMNKFLTLLLSIACVGVGTVAFGSCGNSTEGIVYELSDDGTYAAVVGYKGEAKNIDIAETYRGLPVTNIDWRAFWCCSSLTSIEIPGSVLAIGKYAFYSCDSLTSVVIPDSVLEIGDYAFSGCESLTDIRFNGTVEQWESIEKGEWWNLEASVTKVVCDDGEILF